MINNKLFGGVLALLLICVYVTGCGATPPDPNDPLIGTWVGTGTVLFVGNYNVTLVCDSTGTAQLTGSINVPGATYPVDFMNLTWAQVSGTHYVGQSGARSLDFYLEDDTLTTTVNPTTFGYGMDHNFTITMARLGSSGSSFNIFMIPFKFFGMVWSSITNFFNGLGLFPT